MIEIASFEPPEGFQVGSEYPADGTMRLAQSISRNTSKKHDEAAPGLRTSTSGVESFIAPKTTLITRSWQDGRIARARTYILEIDCPRK